MSSSSANNTMKSDKLKNQILDIFEEIKQDNYIDIFPTKDSFYMQLEKNLVPDW